MKNKAQPLSSHTISKGFFGINSFLWRLCNVPKHRVVFYGARVFVALSGSDGWRSTFAIQDELRFKK